MSWGEGVALGTAVLFFIVGLAGVFIPVIPGVMIAYVGILIYAIVDGFQLFPPWLLIFLGFLAVAASLLDNVAGIYGARRFGASRWGVWGAVIGLLVGLFFTPLGIIVGPMAGALTGELLGGKEAGRAAKAGLGTLVGFLGGVFAKLVMVLTLIVVFFYKLGCG